MDNIATNMEFEEDLDENLIHLTDTKPNSKEAKIQMIRKMMEELLEDVIDDNIKDGCDILTNALNNYEQLDQSMIARLNDIFSNDLIKKKEYADIVKAIGQGSTVVYFKSAQLFKVYKKTELETLLGGQLRTIYKQLNESFEVVPNESKQKIVMLCDISLEDKIERIKTYIVSFMVNEGITRFTDNDIVCYKGREALEIIINDYYVDNQEEHDKVVQKLLKYITQQEKSSNIERYIATATYSEFDGVKMIPMPSEKELFATKYIEPLLTMISNVQKCSGFKNQINLSVTIDNSVNNHIDNSVDNSTSTTIVNSSNSGISDFGEYIKTNKPSWYKPGKTIEKNKLHAKYVEIFGEISKPMFHKMFIGKIFKNPIRVTEKNKKISKVTMLRYYEIETFEE